MFHCIFLDLLVNFCLTFFSLLVTFQCVTLALLGNVLLNFQPKCLHVCVIVYSKLFFIPYCVSAARAGQYLSASRAERQMSNSHASFTSVFMELRKCGVAVVVFLCLSQRSLSSLFQI